MKCPDHPYRETRGCGSTDIRDHVFQSKRCSFCIMYFDAKEEADLMESLYLQACLVPREWRSYHDGSQDADVTAYEIAEPFLHFPTQTPVFRLIAFFDDYHPRGIDGARKALPAKPYPPGFVDL